MEVGIMSWGTVGVDESVCVSWMSACNLDDDGFCVWDSVGQWCVRSVLSDVEGGSSPFGVACLVKLNVVADR